MPGQRIKLLPVLLLLLWTSIVCGQKPLSDLDLLKRRSFERPEFDRKKSSFMWVSSGNVLLKYNPLSLTFGALMYTYQNVLSKHISATCLYSPSCSQFSRKLITDFGLVKGMFLSADRIMRCNRIAAMDISPSEADEKDHKVHETTAIYKKR
ncbi:MAG: membrane protein insertion efficiency factor YidD [Bacteroidetes bacterium]|nr:membrane protein insertion efficiency factor YidD [Bacteroidota bacterium]